MSWEKAWRLEGTGLNSVAKELGFRMRDRAVVDSRLKFQMECRDTVRQMEVEEVPRKYG